MSTMVAVEHLRKQYDPPNGHVAVDDLSFTIERGEVFSLLGPNGAGKTTTMSMLSCLLEPSSGTITIGGYATRTHARSVKQMIGVVPQEIALYPTISAYDNLAFWGSMYGLSGAYLRERIGVVLDIAGLTDRARSPVKTFSGGMQRRLNIAVALLHNPDIIYLDEPTVGIDPQSRRRILDSLKELNQQGLTILYTTHYMEEAEELSHRIGIMDQGRLKSIGTLESLKRQVGFGHTISMALSASPPEQELFAAQVAQLSGIRQLAHTPGHIAFETASVHQTIASLMQCAERDAIEIHELAVHQPNLETVFLHLTGRTLRDA